MSNKVAGINGIGAYLFGEAKYAVQDIRQKVFEEAFFGRVVTAAPVIEVNKTPDVEKSDRSALQELWVTVRQEPGQEKERAAPEPELSPELEESLAMESYGRWLEKEDIDREPDIER